MSTISVVIATLNEEKNISRCLESVRQLADEIVVVDAKSEDNTVKISRKFNTKIFVIHNNLIFHKNKQYGLEKATCPWILQLDADEVVTKELTQEIKEATKNSHYNGYYIPRKNFFLGKFMRKGGLYPDLVIRLIKKGKAYFPCESVHEQIRVLGEVGTLKNPLLHYSYPNLSTYLIKANRYTTLTSEELYQSSLKISIKNTLTYCIVKPFQTFIDIFIRHGGYIDGLHGLIWAFLSSSHYFLAYAKLFTHKNIK